MTLPIANATLPRTGTRSYLAPRAPNRLHNGIDLPAPKGTPVRAAAPGVVRHAHSSWVQGFTGYGRVVTLEHPGGTHTLYAHLDAVHVVPGEQVAAGQVVGKVGNSLFSKAGGYTNESGGAHLHFETAARAYPMPSSAARIDPVQWLLGSREGEKIAAGAGAAALAFALGAAAWIVVARGRR